MTISRACDWREVTAIIPAYRCARFLPAAIQSLLQCPMDIVIAEDRSGDETLRVAEEWRRQFPRRIRVLQGEENVGVSANFNRALKSVRTTFVMKLDGDDVVFPEYARRAYDFIYRHDDLAMICGDSCPIGPSDYLSLSSEPHPPKGYDSARVSVMSGLEACRFVLKWDPYPCSSGAIYRTECLRTVGGMSVGMTWAEDREIWFRLARRWPVAFLNAPGAFYRRHPDSATVLHRSQNRAAVADSRLIIQSRRLWPEYELLPDFARTLFRVARDCRRSAVQALRSGNWTRATECGCAYVNTLARGAAFRLRSTIALQGWHTVIRHTGFAGQMQRSSSDPGGVGDA